MARPDSHKPRRKNSLMLPVPPLVTRTLLLTALLFLSAASARAATLTASILDKDRVSANDEGYWAVKPAGIGMSRVPSPVMRVDASEPIPHQQEYAIRIDLETKERVIVYVFGIRANQTVEVLSTRETTGLGRESLLWALEERIGRASDLVAFEVAFVRAGEAENSADAQVFALDVVNAGDLSDAELLAASSFEPVSVRFRQLFTGAEQQRLSIVVPKTLMARYPDAEVHARDSLRDLLKATFGERQETGLEMALFESAIPVSIEPGETERIEAYLVTAEGEEVPLGETTYRLVARERSFRQFEVPFQTIRSFDVIQNGPDLMMLTVVRDRYVRTEPRGAETMTHEMLTHTVSASSGRFETQPTWRVPAFSHWAEAGFRAVGVGKIRDSFAIIVSGGDHEGIETIGLAATAANSPVRPSVRNPVYAPPREFLDWTQGQSLATRGSTVLTFGRTFLIPMLAQVGEGDPRLIAAMTTNMRTFTDAGIIPVDVPETLDGHVDVFQRDGLYYMLTDDPKIIWTAADPLRDWRRHEINLPDTWRAYRLAEHNGKTYLFGLADWNGHSVIRWVPVSFGDGEVPLPRLSGPVEGDAS